MKHVSALLGPLTAILALTACDARDASPPNSAQGGNPAVAVVPSDACPQLSIRATPQARGVEFTASAPSQAPVSFSWSVSAGTIIAGQGSESIVVEAPNGPVTAMVEVSGLPTGCKGAAETTAIIR